MNILITGCAGFIGFHVAGLISQKHKVIGIDNLNNYYDVKLKKKRISILKKSKKFIFFKVDISNIKKLNKIFSKYKITHIVNLAAQAGVRYSIKKPSAYTISNLIGFANILELSKKYKINHLITASTSSVYGNSNKKILSENDNTDRPIQYYAATKKANEIMAHSYSYLYNIPITVLRFFTVYGTWGRPDMAIFKFTKSILKKQNIEVYNHGNHSRGFTHVSTICYAVNKIIEQKFYKNKLKYNILNIGGSKSIHLMKLIKLIENKLKIKAKITFTKLQPGDVINTRASLFKINQILKNYKQKNLKEGIGEFVDWFKSYYKY